MNAVLDFSILAIVFFLILVDQAIKFLVVAYMKLGESIPVLAGIFHITYIENPGAAFGLFANQRVIFIVAAALVIVAACLMYRRLMSEKVIVRWGVALLLGGAAGNLIDRVRIGCVIDFLDFRIWPVFNIADIGICIGVTLLMYALLYDNEKEKE